MGGLISTEKFSRLVPYAGMFGQGLAITVTNTRETPILTGVTLDTVPYLLLLCLALSGLAGLVIKRRAD